MGLYKAGQLRQHPAGTVFPAKAALKLLGAAKTAAVASPPSTHTSGCHQALFPESWPYPWPRHSRPVELPCRLGHSHLARLLDLCPPWLSDYLSLCGAGKIRVPSSRDGWLCCPFDFSPFSLAALGRAHLQSWLLTY